MTLSPVIKQKAADRLPVIFALLLIGFCLFKTERYILERPTMPAPTRPAIELVVSWFPSDALQLPDIFGPAILPESDHAPPDTLFDDIFQVLQHRCSSIALLHLRDHSFHSFNNRYGHFRRAGIPHYSSEYSDPLPVFSHS